MNKTFLSIACIYIISLPIKSFTQTNHSTLRLQQYLWANYLQAKNETPEEIRKMYEASIIPHEPIIAHAGYIRLLFKQEEYAQLVQLEKKYINVFSNDVEIQRIFAIALEKRGNHTQAIERFIDLNKKFDSDADIALRVSQHYIAQNQLDAALTVIDNVLNNAPNRSNNFLFYYLKSQIYTVRQDWKEARVHIKKSIELFPHLPQSWLLSAVIEEQQGQLEDAIKDYSYFLQTTQTKNPTVELHLTRLMMRQQTTGQKSISGQNGTSLNHALSLYAQGKYETALTVVEKLLAQNRKDTQARLVKLQILEAQKKTSLLFRQISDWIDENPDNHFWYKILHSIGRSLTYYPPLRILKIVEKQFPNKPLPVLYQADIYLRLENSGRAKQYLSRAVSMTTDSQLKTRILFQLGLLHYSAHEYEQVRATLEKAHTLSPDYAPVLHRLAYYYVHKTNQISQAQTLIEKALQQQPGNRTFQATQAFIFYKTGRYESAHTLLEKITQKEPNDFSALKLLSKTLYKQGKIETALETMQTAQLAAQCKQDLLCSKKYMEQWQTHEKE